MNSIEDEWLWGWDPTPGIVSVWAENAQAVVWRRIPETGLLVREEERYRPWLLLDRLDDLEHVGAALGLDGDPNAQLTFRELAGDGALRYLVSAENAQLLTNTVLQGATRRLGRHVRHIRELDEDGVLMLPAEEQ